VLPRWYIEGTRISGIDADTKDPRCLGNKNRISGMGTIPRRIADNSRTWVRLAVALVGLLMVSGCSRLEIAYAFAEDMLESRAETYLELSPEQEVRLEAQSVALVAWHRKVMLPKYAAFFSAQADVAEAGGWTRAEFKRAFAEFRDLIDETVEGASPFIASVLVDHTAPKNIVYLETRMAENNAERRAEEADETPEELREKWVERRVERIARFTGTLSERQVTIVRRHTKSGMGYVLRWRDNRLKRQDALLAFLRARPTQNDLAHFVHRILLHAHEIVDPDYGAVSEARWQLNERMYFEVLSSLSDAQRRELAATLRSYASDMVELAGA